MTDRIAELEARVRELETGTSMTRDELEAELEKIGWALDSWQARRSKGVYYIAVRADGGHNPIRASEPEKLIRKCKAENEKTPQPSVRIRRGMIAGGRIDPRDVRASEDGLGNP